MLFLKKFMLKKRSISVTWFITFVALYQATILNYVYYRQVLAILQLDSFDNIILFLTMPIIVFCAVFALLNICYFKNIIKIVSILLILIGSSLAYFMNKFNILIDRDMLENSLQTTTAESLSYLSFSLVLTILIFGIIPTLFILSLSIKKERFGHYFIKRIMAIISPFIVVLIISFFLFKNYAPFMRNNPQIIKYLLPSNYIASVISEVKYLQYKNEPWKNIGVDIQKKSNSKKPILFVVVMGETARSDNFSLYGYDKQTNPLLEQQNNLFVFKNTTSCGTFTAYSVPCIFSQYTRTDYSAKVALRQDNVLDLLNRADTNIEWLENDGGCKGVCDRILNREIIDEYKAKESPLCNSGVCYDEVLLNELQNSLTAIETTKTKNDQLIVLHTIGSHGPTYYKRYPKSFKKFTPTCDTNEIDRCSKESLINTYDNTIVYTDYIINDVIEQLKPLQEKFNVGMIYLSDHGESLGENGIYLHGLPYNIAPKEQKSVPFMLWLSPSYQNELNLNKPCLIEQSEKTIHSQDQFFHTLLDLFFMKTKVYDKTLNILNSCSESQ